MRRLPPTRALAIAACVLAGVGLAACSSNSAVRATTSTTRPTTTTSTLPPTSTSTSTSSTTTTTAAPGACQGSQLSVSRNDFSGAAGELSVGFSLLNRGTVPCSISGYPTLLLEGTGAPVAVTSHSGQGPAFQLPSRAIVLAAGAQAGFVYEFSDVQSNGSQCTIATAISVTLPATGATATTIPYKAYPCGGPGAVSAIVSESQEHAQFS